MRTLWEAEEVMILTSQLSQWDDEQARQLLANHPEYDHRPSYMAQRIAGAEHVAASYLDVIRVGWSKMTAESRRDPEKRELRREFLLQLVAAHLGNRELVRHFRF